MDEDLRVWMKSKKPKGGSSGGEDKGRSRDTDRRSSGDNSRGESSGDRRKSDERGRSR